MKRLSSLLRAFVRHEHRCQACMRICVSEPNDELSALLCPICRSDLTPRTQGYCPLCGKFYAQDSIRAHLCATCLQAQHSKNKQKLPPWNSLCFYNAYDGLLRRLILEFKLSSRLTVSALLQELLFQAYMLRNPNLAGHLEAMPDIIIPIPLHSRRLASRGFNQSLELSRLLASRCSININTGALKRRRPTRPQFELDKKERHANIKGAFHATHEVRGKTILLVDDIMTSGATLTEATHCLLDANAHSVSVLVLARTMA